MLKEKAKSRMHAVGVDGLVNQVTQKEGEHHGAPCDTKESERDDEGFVWYWYKSGIEKNNWNEPLTVVFVDMLKSSNELRVFEGERITTHATKDVADEVSYERADSEGENNPKETHASGGKNWGERDRWNRQNHIKAGNGCNDNYPKVAEGSDFRLEVGVTKEVLSKEEGATRHS